MIYELFLVGTFWFWAVVVVEACWLLRCLHEESGYGIGFSLGGLTMLLWLFGDFNIFTWIWLNPILLVECTLAYLVIGALWSALRFRILCTDTRDLLEDAKQEFKDENQIKGEIPAEKRKKWREFAEGKTWPGKRYHAIRSIEDIIPKPRYHKATIMYWLGYWPLSMLWFFFHDLIEKVVNRIYRVFVRLYESIARSAFSGIKDDFGGDDGDTP